MMSMKVLLLTVGLSLFLIQHAQAVTISIISEGTVEHPAIILINGQFLRGEDKQDIQTFQDVAVRQKHGAIVFLNSPGGVAWTAIQIGLTIRQYRFATAVADDTKCTSSCAIAWLGGAERYMGNKAYIGFHAIKQPDSLVPSSNGNAIVGAYYYQIGITNYKTIDYLTKAPPQSMVWIKQPMFQYLDIEVKPFSYRDEKWIWAGMEMGLRRHERVQPAGLSN
jgi:hypothetical protein